MAQSLHFTLEPLPSVCIQWFIIYVSVVLKSCIHELRCQYAFGLHTDWKDWFWPWFWKSGGTFRFFFFFLLRVIFYILKCLPELQVVFLSVCFLINGSFIYLTEYCYLFLMSVNWTFHHFTVPNLEKTNVGLFFSPPPPIRTSKICWSEMMMTLLSYSAKLPHLESKYWDLANV